MSLTTKKQNNKNSADITPPKIFCPYCKSDSTNPIDPKKAFGKKSFYICLVCGETFEYEREDSK
jgi:transposase-like protein